MASGLRRRSVLAREILWRHNGVQCPYCQGARSEPGTRAQTRRAPNSPRARNRNFFHAALAGAAGDMLLRREFNP